MLPFVFLACCFLYSAGWSQGHWDIGIVFWPMAHDQDDDDNYELPFLSILDTFYEPKFLHNIFILILSALLTFASCSSFLA